MTELLAPPPSLAADTILGTGSRHAGVDNLKIVLVTGVIVGHATMAWTNVGNWIFEEPVVREPLLSLLVSVSMIGAAFAMPLFFLIAGAFTSGSLARKGPKRFLSDRAIRLGVPVLFYVILLSPLIEYVDPGNAGWDRGFAAFVTYIWWPPAWGPTWFLVVLLAFSAAYAGIRTLVPPRPTVAAPPRGWHLAGLVVLLAVASWLVRFGVPLGEEPLPLRFALGQSPAWVIGFVLGVVGGERGWYAPMDQAFARRARHAAWVAIAGFVIIFGGLLAAEVDLDELAGGGTLLSLLAAVLEAGLVVTVPLWMLDLFHRRFGRQGSLARTASRAAFAAFVIHQLVLVGFVLASHQVTWPPEVEYLTVSILAVAASFAVAALALRVPGVAKVV